MGSRRVNVQSFSAATESSAVYILLKPNIPAELIRAKCVNARLDPSPSVRIYTINKGEMDNFLKYLKEDIVPLHEKIGVPIVGTWVNRPQSEFIWVRTYKDKAEMEAKNKEF